jgi:hypothetical protein
VRFSLALLGLGVLLVAPRASAFCRTTTSPVPIGYDPVSSGCFTQGIPLVWSESRAPYGVVAAASDQVPLADATRIADEAFSAWNNARCAGGSTPAIQAYDDGPIASAPDASDCSSSATCDPATHDYIVFDDKSWPYDDPANTLALTTVTYGVDDGHIFEAKTEVNSAKHKLTTTEPPPSGGSVYDLQAILTHEAGHFFGLAHATLTTSIMYAYYQPGAVQLTSDDIDGFCTVYPHGETLGGGSGSGGSSGGSGCALARAEGSSGVLGLGGLGVAAVSVARAPRRRAPRRAP